MKRLLSALLALALCLSFTVALSSPALAIGSLLYETEAHMSMDRQSKTAFDFYVTKAGTVLDQISYDLGYSLQPEKAFEQQQNLSLRIYKYYYPDFNLSFPTTPQNLVAEFPVSLQLIDGAYLTDTDMEATAANMNLALGYGTYRCELSPQSSLSKVFTVNTYGIGIYGTGGVTAAMSNKDVYTYGMDNGLTYDQSAQLVYEYLGNYQQQFSQELAAAEREAQAAYDAKPITLKVNGTAIYCDSPPIIENGRTLVPLRALCESLGYNVEWEQSTKTVYILYPYTDEVVMYFKVDSQAAHVYSEDGWSSYTITMDVPARLVNSRVLIPARAISEALGFDVSWDNENKTVLIVGTN